MLDNRIHAVAIHREITLLNDNDESTCYLVTGERRALLVDTANGWVDMKALCEECTSLPVTVVNTHGHGDHVFGNVYFSEAHLHPADFILHDQCFADPIVHGLMESEGLRPAKLMALAIGEMFDLGGGHMLETVSLAGHTAGSVGLLDRKHRILFSGDGVIPHLWMQLEESLPIETLHNTLVTLKREHGDEFDWLLTGHGRGLESADIVDNLIIGCEQLLQNDHEGECPYHWFGGDCVIHPIDEDENHGIVYNDARLEGLL